MTKKLLYRGLSVLFAVLFIVMLGASAYAFEAEADVNQRLGTKSYEIVAEEGEEPVYYYSKKTSDIDTHMRNKLALIEDIVDEGAVLVKNNGTLPLKTAQKITLLGYSSVAPVYNGKSGNAAIGNSGIDVINIPFKAAFEKAGFQINPSMWNYYKSHNKSESEASDLPTEDLSEYDDAVIVFISRNAGEGSDAVAGYYDLTSTELALVDKASEISENVIVINNSPSPLSCDEFEEESDVDAMIVVGGLGAVGTYSVANIIRGTVNPSGHLPDVYAAKSMSSPAYQTSGTTAYSNADDIINASPLGNQESNTKYTVQNEGIYIGYKYYETRYEDVVLGQGNANSTTGIFGSTGNWKYADEVTYSFGYGLSYTEFKQTIKSFGVYDNVISIDVEVENIGSVAGKDVVELYVQSPYTEYDKTNKVEKSAIQLVNFAKTGMLNAGAKETVTIKMDVYNIASYDYTNAKTWILDAGKYYFAIGNGAHDALNNVLAAKGKTVSDGMTSSGNADKVKTWDVASLIKLDSYEFGEDGFTTEDDLFHNDYEGATNKLASGDINSYIPNKVTYLSRNDWSGTWATELASISATSEMIKKLAFDYTPGTAVSTDSAIKYGQDTNMDISALIGLDYDHELWQTILEQMTVEEMIYTVGKNFGAIDPILSINFPGTSDNDGVGSGPAKNYLAAYNHGSTIFEGLSKYSDIDCRMYPSETVDASTFNQKLLYELGESQSEDCYYAGLNTLWGPGCNIHHTPYSGRNFEYFSEDSMLSYVMGAQVTAGIQSNGCVACPKHFVFNDIETDRYGYGVWQNEQEARESSLRAFEGALAVAKAGNCMTGLNRVGCEWAGACSAVQNAIARDEWGFKGYFITDNAAKPYMYGRSVVFGNDKMMLLPGNNRNGELNKTAVLADKTLFLALRESSHRILYVYVNSNAMNGTYANMHIVPVAPWWKVTLIIIDVILGIVAVGLCALYVFAQIKGNKEGE